MKLPKIVLKRFDGNPTNFQNFWDSYNTSIHENEDISDVNKMAYLFGLLKGSAYSAVKGFTMTCGNCKEVIDVLHECFGSKDLIISSHMDALLKLPLVNNSDTKRLRSVYDLVQGVNGLNLYLTANTVPVICAPLQNQCIELSKDNIPHFQGLELADNSFGHSEIEIDLLVGADFYWTFLMGGIIR